MRTALLLLVVLSCTFVSTAQTEFKKVSSEEDVYGYWTSVDTVEVSILGEEAPTVYYFALTDSKSYFSSYIDPDFGASLDIEFTYERSGNVFDCILTGSVALGYFMEHENEAFQFQLSYRTVDGVDQLQLTNQHGTYLFEPYE